MQCAARSSEQLVVCVQCPCSVLAVFSLLCIVLFTASGHKSAYLWDLLAAAPTVAIPTLLVYTLSLCPFPIFTYLLTSTLPVTQIVTRGP